MFDLDYLDNCSWYLFERFTARFLMHNGYKNIQHIGKSGDKGADILAAKKDLITKKDKTYLIQCKFYSSPLPKKVIEETVNAYDYYGVDKAIIISKTDFQKKTVDEFRKKKNEGYAIEIWNLEFIKKLNDRLKTDYPFGNPKDFDEERPYQIRTISKLHQAYNNSHINSAMIVMATGLGKTKVISEYFRERLLNDNKDKILILADKKNLVSQLEISFWKSLKPNTETLIWNSDVVQVNNAMLESADIIFATNATVFKYLKKNEFFTFNFDFIVIDECHHVGDVDSMYGYILDQLSAGQKNGPFLLGATATPFRGDSFSLSQRFSDPLVSYSMKYGLENGYLCQVDYRLQLDNTIDWHELRNRIPKLGNSPKGINRNIFITEWDEGVIKVFHETASEIENPKSVIFCGRIDHAKKFKNKINSFGKYSAEIITSGQDASETAKIIGDLAAGKINVVCTVDKLNEGIDIPDINLIVFQRVTHSRKIFIQQLGRGLRIKEGKEKVIVLDFVTDIKRVADSIKIFDNVIPRRNVEEISINTKLSFKRLNDEANAEGAFLKEWLKDIADVSNEDSEMHFPDY